MQCGTSIVSWLLNMDEFAFNGNEDFYILMDGHIHFIFDKIANIEVLELAASFTN